MHNMAKQDDLNKKAASDIPQAALLSSGETGGQPKGTSPMATIAVLRKRSDFLKAAKARRAPCPAFLVQARKRAPTENAGDLGIRVGFTCSKKVGNAVARNRAKRRLREIARLILPVDGLAGYDYVLVGRADHTATHDFAAMQADFRRALKKLHT